MFSTYWIHFTQKKNVKSSPRGSNGRQSSLLRIFDHDPNDPLSRKSWIPQAFLKKVPIEPLAKTIFPALGILVELFMDFRFSKKDGRSHFMLVHYTVEFVGGRFLDLNRFYHISLYSSFMLSGIIDLLSICIELPRAVSQLFLCFALYSESLLFSFHVHGRNPFNTSVHLLLLIFVIASAVFATVRLFNPRNLFINAGFSCCMILQGTHLIQAGWILYGGIQWDYEWHENLKFICALSVWQLLGVSSFMVITFIITKAFLIRLAKTGRFSSLLSNQGEEEREGLLTERIDIHKPGSAVTQDIEMCGLIDSSPA